MIVDITEFSEYDYFPREIKYINCIYVTYIYIYIGVYVMIDMQLDE